MTRVRKTWRERKAERLAKETQWQPNSTKEKQKLLAEIELSATRTLKLIKEFKNLK